MRSGKEGVGQGLFFIAGAQMQQELVALLLPLLPALADGLSGGIWATLQEEFGAFTGCPGSQVLPRAMQLYSEVLPPQDVTHRRKGKG